MQPGSVEFTKYLQPEVISKISSLDLRAKYIVEGFMLGLHKSPYHGFSIEFSQHRPYMQGDSLKSIDWKIYGKTDRYFVKQYEEETNLKCYIAMDCSKSMNFSSKGNVTKFHYASMLAASLSFLMLKQKDAVSLTLYDETINKFLPPNASQIYLKEILFAISQATPSSKTETGKSLHTVAEKIKKRGLVIVISDFFDDPEAVISSLKHLRYNKNEVIVFHILDPIETAFGFKNDSVFVDLETGEEMTTQPHQIRKAYREAMDNFINSIKSNCLNFGIDYNLIETSANFDKALFSYLKKRSRLY